MHRHIGPSRTPTGTKGLWTFWHPNLSCLPYILYILLLQVLWIHQSVDKTLLKNRVWHCLFTVLSVLSVSPPTHTTTRTVEIAMKWGQTQHSWVRERKIERDRQTERDREGDRHRGRERTVQSAGKNHMHKLTPAPLTFTRLAHACHLRDTWSSHEVCTRNYIWNRSSVVCQMCAWACAHRHGTNTQGIKNVIVCVSLQMCAYMCVHVHVCVWVLYGYIGVD